MAGGSGSSQLSTMYFEEAGALTAQDAANAVHTFWDSIKAFIYSGYTLQVEPEVVSIHVEDGKPTAVTAVSVAQVTGTGGSDPLPWSSQGLVRWSTGEFINGRQVLGHTYIPGPLEVSNVGGVPDGSYRTPITTACGVLNSDPLCNFMIYSRKNFTAVNVLGGQVWTKWAVLRSRRD